MQCIYQAQQIPTNTFIFRLELRPSSIGQWAGSELVAKQELVKAWFKLHQSEVWQITSSHCHSFPFPTPHLAIGLWLLEGSKVSQCPCSTKHSCAANTHRAWGTSQMQHGKIHCAPDRAVCCHPASCLLHAGEILWKTTALFAEQGTIQNEWTWQNSSNYLLFINTWEPTRNRKSSERHPLDECTQGGSTRKNQTCFAPMVPIRIHSFPVPLLSPHKMECIDIR